MTDLLSKCDQIRSFFRIWSHLLKNFLMENVICLCSERLKDMMSVWPFLDDMVKDLIL